MMQRWRAFLAVLALASLVTGCASGSLRSVQDKRWQAVPGDVRAAIDRVHSKVVAQALEERRLADLALAEARAALERSLATRQLARGSTVAPQAGDEAWRAAWLAHEKAQAEALGHIDAGKRAWLRAVVRWRQHRLAAADLRVSVVRAGFELAKAQAVDGYTPADEGYDVASYRGQFARLHEAWSEARQRADAARSDAERLGRELAAAKEEYARMRRTGPGAQPPLTATGYRQRVPHMW